MFNRKIYIGENTPIYMTSHEETRKERIKMIRKVVSRTHNKEELIAKCCMEWGTSRRTILEYIKMIELING